MEDKITNIHKAQTLNYLKATGLRLAILLNFGKNSLEPERLVFKTFRTFSCLFVANKSYEL